MTKIENIQEQKYSQNSAMIWIQESRYTAHAVHSTKTLNSNQAWKLPNLEEGENRGINKKSFTLKVDLRILVNSTPQNQLVR